MIGVGGRGKANWSKIPKENIVALCDVDDNRAASGYKMFPKVKKYKDFRVMFDQMAKEIDAVIITTPDHTHFAATMIAMELGIHVYVEKPLAHNVWQLRTMKKAAQYYKVISQMGNQGHTTNGIRLIKRVVRPRNFWVKLERFTLGMVLSILPLEIILQNPKLFLLV